MSKGCGLRLSDCSGCVLFNDCALHQERLKAFDDDCKKILGADFVEVPKQPGMVRDCKKSEQKNGMEVICDVEFPEVGGFYFVNSQPYRGSLA